MSEVVPKLLRLVGSGVLALALAACQDSSTSMPPAQTSPPDGGEQGLPDAGQADAAVVPVDLRDTLERIRSAAKLPGLAALALRGNTIVGEGAVGLRRVGDSAQVGQGDVFLLGEDVQAMTATVAALLVADGKISLSATLDEVLGPSGFPMHADYKPATLGGLLSHNAGVPPTLSAAAAAALRAPGDARQRRTDAVRIMLSEGPKAPPNLGFERASGGYLLAAAMLEQIAGTSFETLTRERLFLPLGMGACSFGPPDSGTSNIGAPQPSGHTLTDGAFVPVDASSLAEPAAAFAPAGSVRCSLRDWSKFGAMHLAGARGDKGLLLSPEAFRTLHTPVGATYALGWNSVSRPWSGDVQALNYGSGNAHFHALIWIAPAKNVAFLVAANAGAPEAAKAVDDVVGALVAAFVTSAP